MKVTVKEVFQDKFTLKHYAVGQEIEVSDQKRIEVLKSKGLVDVPETVTEEPRKKSTKRK